MDNPTQPKSPLLGLRDLYTAPCPAEAFAGLIVGHGRLPVRLHFTLADGRDFHLPISDVALRQLASALAALRPSQDRRPDGAARQDGVGSVATPDTLACQPSQATSFARPGRLTTAWR